MKTVKNIILMLSISAIAVAGLLNSTPAHAHDFFVSTVQSTGHPPGHFTAIIGWGHALPIDSFLAGNRLKSYSLYDPQMNKIDFPFDPETNMVGENSKGVDYPDLPGVNIRSGDIFSRQVSFTNDSPRGTYQVAAVKKRTQFSVWKDSKGKQRWGRKPMDEIKDAKEILVSRIYQSFAKAFATHGKWTQPEALGHALEIIPLTDLSQVKKGDFVSFRVLKMGKPVQTDGATEKPVLELFGNHFCHDKKCGVIGRIRNGIATIRIPEAGQWIAIVKIRTPVTKKAGPKHLVGKFLEVGYHSTITFNAK